MNHPATSSEQHRYAFPRTGIHTEVSRGAMGLHPTGVAVPATPPLAPGDYRHAAS